uniref:Uncharacterized protein n=1 Tax=Nelumbo nucifera TaxID=4432 RepID=A0A822YMM8_NELNU|nr:TPA_asm: hypothetical protein HUJ06_011126 [Nelumbo nucifera]
MALVRERRQLSLRLPLPDSADRRPRFPLPLPPSLLPLRPHHHRQHSRYRPPLRPREAPGTRPRQRRHSLQSPPQAHLRHLRPQGRPGRLRHHRPPPDLPRNGNSPTYGFSLRRPMPRSLREANRRHRLPHGVYGRRHPRERPQIKGNLQRILAFKHRSSSTQWS